MIGWSFCVCIRHCASGYYSSLIELLISLCGGKYDIFQALFFGYWVGVASHLSANYGGAMEQETLHRMVRKRGFETVERIALGADTGIYQQFQHLWHRSRQDTGKRGLQYLFPQYTHTLPLRQTHTPGLQSAYRYQTE